jgi:putative transposase
VWWVFSSVKRCMSFNFRTFLERVLCWVKPPATSLVPGTLADLTRGKLELLAENALLRQQLIILRRQVKRPTYRKTDRLLLVFLARMARTWKQALFLVQPETLLRWHRELFRLFWKRKTKACARKSKLSPETICLIKEMAAKNRRLVSGAYSGRTAQVGCSREQTNHPEVYEAHSPETTEWAELENVLAQSCGRCVGL